VFVYAYKSEAYANKVVGHIILPEVIWAMFKWNGWETLA